MNGRRSFAVPLLHRQCPASIASRPATCQVEVEVEAVRAGIGLEGGNFLVMKLSAEKGCERAADATALGGQQPKNQQPTAL